MAATNQSVLSGLPSPRSPTLSDAGMILPDEPTRSFSPQPYTERPPSPSSLLYHHSNQSGNTIKLNSAPKGRRDPSREPSPQAKSPPLSARSSRSTLRNQTSMEGVSQKQDIRDNDGALASSPILATSFDQNIDNMENRLQRRRSDSSGSIHSDDLEKMRWPGFDSSSGLTFDDSGVDLEEEEQAQFPSEFSTDGDNDKERWLDGQEGEEDDRYSSAALSRRAEIILANAKKRLNVMEGNLRGARHSLLASPSSFNNMKMSPELSNHLSATRERDRKLYGGMGPIPPRQRTYHTSPLTSSSSPGHSRVFSETAVPPTFSPTIFLNRTNSDKRASSAMGVMNGAWSSGEGYGHGRFPVRESKSYEVMRDPRGSGLVINEEGDHSSSSYSRGSKSPPHGLEPLPEDEATNPHNLQRSSSTTGSLRVQMSELKGRISSLKERAKEDTLRRRSLQTLKTPSPFTAAEIWYAGADVYKTSPISADAGVGFKQDSPTRKELYECTSSFSSHKTTPTDILDEEDKALEQPALVKTQSNECSESHYEDAEDSPQEDGDLYDDELEDDYDEDDSDFLSVAEDDFEPGESVYEDAVYEMPVTERHEDRIDAFDYEHFFLHSAMGTYSSASRRSSTGSADSIETTRPVTAIQSPMEEPDNSIQRLSIHQRNASVDSVSTMATFATAAEDQSDEEDEDSNEYMDQFSHQILPSSHLAVGQSNGMTLYPSAPTRSDSAINMRATTTNGTTSAEPRVPRASGGSSPAGDLVGAMQTSKIFSILLEAASPSEPRLALNEEEKQLIYGLAASFQQVCANLQNTSGDQYERKGWKSRLDAARKVLNGEEGEDESF
ncbi:hypothetical protein GQ43DRAFT_375084 [Delitschia confertaspora ATCC 74209]|uniref:Uncharacterized protein n=1 Tax=Delitschia confertaspora ATCC 74209 TaxID=1513339 RepID=A0A9P4MNV8_9PLEO|nr:hypothetical protein GQ43DRAFT_375084 [Delitschia confertaspora ATCC 74209]